MNITFFASEATPLIKVGGLADVVGALPEVLFRLGHQVNVVIPGYTHLRLETWKPELEFSVVWNGQPIPVTVRSERFSLSGLRIYALDAPLIMRAYDGVYTESDDPGMQRKEIERFAFFAYAAATLIQQQKVRPDVIHCHDWHAGLVPLLLQLRGISIPTLLTIHNLNIQGKWNSADVFGWLGWKGNESPQLQKRDRDGDINFLQQGIIAATAVNTVSPTYAKEILSPEHGEHLEKDLMSRPEGIYGIVNGIDVQRFNPATDNDLAFPYSLQTVGEEKRKNKTALQRELGLPENPQAFLLGSVGRLNTQKGYQLLPTIVGDILAQEIQLVVLGSGMEEIVRSLQEIAQQYARQVKVIVKFDAHLAQRIYAGADAFVMPSLFEPCGLGQMIAMRYGTLPIVRDTGGLHDTVQDITQNPQNGTGFVFEAFQAEALQGSIQQAFALHRNPSAWLQAQQRAMAQDFSWERSARAYLDLYGKIKNHSKK